MTERAADAVKRIRQARPAATAGIGTGFCKTATAATTEAGIEARLPGRQDADSQRLPITGRSIGTGRRPNVTGPHQAVPCSLTIAKGPASILTPGASARIESDANRSLELRFRRRLCDGPMGDQFGRLEARADDAARCHIFPARGDLSRRTGSMRIACLAALSLIVLTAPETGISAQTLSCHGTQQPRQVAELMFGRGIGNSVGVSESAWTRFLTQVITPRFPDGLTVTDTIGQWRDHDSGAIAREPSKHVEIVLPGNADDEMRLDAIVAAYKRRFRQHSVGVIVRDACVAF